MKKNFLSLVSIVGLACASISVIAKISKKYKCNEMNLEKKLDKYLGYYSVLNKWLSIEQEGSSVESYFLNHGYSTVAIYGLGEIGSHLYEELKKSNKVQVKYGIDKNSEMDYTNLEIYNKIENIEDPVDVVVVTASFAFDEIYKGLESYLDCDIISIEDVIFEL